MARQAIGSIGLPSHYASCDEPGLRGAGWLEAQWEIGRTQAAVDARRGALLVLDEVQKIPVWSETVKRLWDEDSSAGRKVRVACLGSAPLLVQRGLAESLAGRFEILHVPHWSLSEMSAAFGWGLDKYLFYGGYPGAAGLVADHHRWANYVLDSLVETTISRDVLLLTRVDKPALLRQLFRLGCDYSGQILSFNKMLGQLQEAGNTTTLAHYLGLLEEAGMIAGLPKYHGSKVRQRGSSPKLLVLNTALMTAGSGRSFLQARRDREFWGRLVESAVGAHLHNSLRGTRRALSYWRDDGSEVDYVVSGGDRLTAIEVKSGIGPRRAPGLEVFDKAHGPARKLMIGGDGMPLEPALRSIDWF